MAAAPQKSKPRLLELEIVRAVAIVAVVAIHATSEATVQLPFGSGPQLLYLTINKLCNFAVPVFIMVSGLVLFYRYDGDWSGRQAGRFYSRRIRQVLFPYVFWSFFYYLYDQWMFERDRLHIDWAEFAELLPWADASYHLYFMIIIVQFYLLFPLLMWLCHSAGRLGREGLPWLGLLVQALAYGYNHWLEPIPNMASLCINYFSVFALGAWIGLHYEAFSRWADRSFRWLLPLTVLLGCSFAGLFLLEDRAPFLLEGSLYTVLFFVYAALACMTFIRAGAIILKRAPGLSNRLLWLGAVSFGIYLVHPAVLTYWRVHVPADPHDIGAYHANTAASFAVSLLLPWALSALYGQAVRLLRQRRRKAALSRG
ncbi:hypothetical protein PAESOLCIP111_05214 [Paenibacillus solanacearum]|uniref:Acyltransferase 3 domain-containing protein n=1 Tax=Paenibacillus solanacearum TaxID=2048548 RepID=A0A916K917_9BACL|nr:acyltransferase [Paenibacillus solanacearum]CAG7646658.1 hypothetical protein PAESOLCIP111_05214 [Paenibacillus solanacearum]